LLVVEEMAKRTRFGEVDAAKIEKVAYGDEVPRPRFPVCESKVKVEVPAFPKRTVEEAERPFVRRRSVEVEFAGVPKEVVGVNGKLKIVDEVR
jgi:hypothetical protein